MPPMEEPKHNAPVPPRRVATQRWRGFGPVIIFFHQTWWA